MDKNTEKDLKDHLQIKEKLEALFNEQISFKDYIIFLYVCKPQGSEFSSVVPSVFQNKTEKEDVAYG